MSDHADVDRPSSPRRVSRTVVGSAPTDGRGAAIESAAIGAQAGEADPITVVVVSGEIDAASTPLALGAPLSELGPQRHVRLDMSGVTFMDSRGLSAILTQRREMLAAGGSIHIRHASPAVRRILRITGLTDVLCESDAPR